MADISAADQPKTPASAEEMQAEDAQVNPDQAPPPAPSDEPPAASEEDLPGPEAGDDPRKELYARIDAENVKLRGKEPPLFSADFTDEDEVPAGKETQPPPPPPPAEEPPPEAPKEPVVVSRAEFLETFKDFRIKDKVAGEIVEAGVGDWIAASGLEKHYTKRLMDLSKKERELLQQKRESSAPKMSDKEIQEKYDELFLESPYKASRFLKDLETSKEAPPDDGTDETLRVKKAYEEFASAYPDLSQEDWARMNNPAFWQRFADVQEARASKDWFPTFVLAYNHLQREKLEVEQHQVREKVEKSRVESVNKAVERKKSGAVLRTTVQPQKAPAAPQKVLSQQEERLQYIRERKRAAQARMGIK